MTRRLATGSGATGAVEGLLELLGVAGDQLGSVVAVDDLPGVEEVDALARQGSRGPRQAQTRLSGQEVDALLEARTAGATINELAEQFGIHRTTVMASIEPNHQPRQ